MSTWYDKGWKVRQEVREERWKAKAAALGMSAQIVRPQWWLSIMVVDGPDLLWGTQVSLHLALERWNESQLRLSGAACLRSAIIFTFLGVCLFTHSPPVYEFPWSLSVDRIHNSPRTATENLLLSHSMLLKKEGLTLPLDQSKYIVSLSITIHSSMSLHGGSPRTLLTLWALTIRKELSFSRMAY